MGDARQALQAATVKEAEKQEAYLKAKKAYEVAPAVVWQFLRRIVLLGQTASKSRPQLKTEMDTAKREWEAAKDAVEQAEGRVQAAIESLKQSAEGNEQAQKFAGELETFMKAVKEMRKADSVEQLKTRRAAVTQIVAAQKKAVDKIEQAGKDVLKELLEKIELARQGITRTAKDGGTLDTYKNANGNVIKLVETKANGLVITTVEQTKQLAIPASFGSVADYAFLGSSYNRQPPAFPGFKLTSVTIENGITSIGTFAFYNNKLTSVTIPNSVQTIGMGAFAGNQLGSVNIENGITSIEASAFASNQLTSVTIPPSVTEMGRGAFQNNPQLKSVIIPEYLLIKKSALAFQSTHKDQKFFEYDKDADDYKGRALKHLVARPSGRSNRIEDSQYANQELTSVIIPFTVNEIGSSAFSNNKLTWVTIPDISDNRDNRDKVTKIEANAFAGNPQLSTVILPKVLYDKVKDLKGADRVFTTAGIKFFEYDENADDYKGDPLN